MATGEALYDPGQDYSRPELLADGTYDARLKGTHDDWHAAASGYESRTAIFLVEGPDGMTRSMFASLSLSPKAFFTRMFLQACGVTQKIADLNELKSVVDNCIVAKTGQTFKNVVVGTQEARGGYPPKNVIKRFEPAPEIRAVWGGK